MCERPVGHAHDLQVIHNSFLIHQSADAALPERLDVMIRMRELFVISSHKEFAERRRHIHPGSSQVFRLDLGSVIEIASDEHYVRSKLPYHAHDAREKRIASDMAKVGV